MTKTQGKDTEDPSFFSQTPEQSFSNLRPENTSTDQKFGSNLKLHGGQRAHKIKPRDNIGLDFLGQDNQNIHNKTNKKVFVRIFLLF